MRMIPGSASVPNPASLIVSDVAVGNRGIVWAATRSGHLSNAAPTDNAWSPTPVEGQAPPTLTGISAGPHPVAYTDKGRITILFVKRE